MLALEGSYPIMLSKMVANVTAFVKKFPTKTLEVKLILSSFWVVMFINGMPVLGYIAKILAFSNGKSWLLALLELLNQIINLFYIAVFFITRLFFFGLGSNLFLLFLFFYFMFFRQELYHCWWNLFLTFLVIYIVCL